MKLRSMRAVIICGKCGYSFEYSTWGNLERLENVYDKVLKYQLGDCHHCSGKLHIRDAKFEIERPDRIKYVVLWRCKECKQEWKQHESVKTSDLAGKTTFDYFENHSSTYCPNSLCRCTSKEIIGISREV